MKRIILALVAFLGIAGAASAQKFQIQAGYGGYTQMDATDMSDGSKVNSAWGAATLGFNARITPKIRLGATYTFSSASFKHTDANVYYNVVLFNGFYDYFSRGDLKLYAHLGLGFDISHMSGGSVFENNHFSTNQAYFAFQASPLGAEYNIGSGCNLFCELGFGAQGLLQVGVRMNF
ncbi:MAG: outer membrane beta-barrel protein [Muribaculaceae bacterium]|nr:outer membrane beta-barrel protein [Muribaculaceae bacterium]